MKTKYFLIILVLGFPSCKKEASNKDTGPQVDVYVSGFVSDYRDDYVYPRDPDPYYRTDPEGAEYPSYWKNGNLVKLDTDLLPNVDYGLIGGRALSIAVSGNDAYVAGMEWNGKSYQDASGSTYKKSVAKYWKNSQPVILTDGTEDAYAESIAVSGTDVYVAGTEWNGKSYQIQGNAYIYRKSIAKYWKNGQAINLTDGTEDAVAKSIAISGTDVYVAGTVNGYATYWKNGVAVKLSNVESDANSIFLVKH